MTVWMYNSVPVQYCTALILLKIREILRQNFENLFHSASRHAEERRCTVHGCASRGECGERLRGVFSGRAVSAGAQVLRRRRRRGRARGSDSRRFRPRPPCRFLRAPKEMARVRRPLCLRSPLQSALPFSAPADPASASPAIDSRAGRSSGVTNKTASQRFLSPDFISDAVSRAAPALVNLTIEVSGWGGAVGQSTGSGFIISEDGYVVTNNHVVAAGGSSHGNSVIVTLSNGRKYRGRVHSTDKKSDLALVKIEPRRRGERFPVMKLGTSCNLKPGQWVVALGSPLTLQNTVTAGIISSVARHSSEIGMSNNRNEYIQTDAAINVGNSGGPLINIDGEVIGINTMKTAQGAGIGFAIPMDSAWQVIKQLRAHRKVIRPYVGMRMVTLDQRSSRTRECRIQTFRLSRAEFL